MNDAPIRCIIADDEPLARKRLRSLLASHRDFALVAECADGPEVIEAIERDQPDAVFLDIRMVRLDGMRVARCVEGDASPAIVFVTAYDEYALEAFEVSAVDYLLKPFDEDRFLAAIARIREHVAALRIRQAHESLLATLGNFAPAGLSGRRGEERPLLAAADVVIDESAREVRRGGVPVFLRPKEFELLRALVRRAGEVITRRDLLHEVWGYKEDVVSRTLDTHIAELRRKLGHLQKEPGYIEAVARVGYRMRVAEDSSSN